MLEYMPNKISSKNKFGLIKNGPSMNLKNLFNYIKIMKLIKL